MKRKVRYGAVISIICAAALWGSACSQKTDKMVIGEKKESQETKETEEDQEREEETAKENLAVIVEAPEKYEINVHSDKVEITADAFVQVPDTDAIPEREIKLLPYSEADYQNLKKIVGSYAGIQWGEDKPWEEAEGLQCYDLDESYYIYYNNDYIVQKGEGGSAVTPVLRASSVIYHTTGQLAGAAFNQEEKNQIEENIREKADQLVAQLNSGQFVRREEKWVQKSIYKQENGIWKNEDTDDQLMILKYVRVLDNIPISQWFYVSGIHTSIEGPQYIELCLDKEGKLVYIKDIARMEIGDPSGEEEFLLPFEAVSQIFQQYFKAFYDNSKLPPLTEGEKYYMYVNVEKVNLEYRRVFQDGQWKLIPVWNFYGFSSASYMDRKEERLLLSIDGRDGNILTY